MARVAGPYARNASNLLRCSLTAIRVTLPDLAMTGARWCRNQTMAASTTIEQLLDLDSLLNTEDIELRTMVGPFGEQRLRPFVADWFETGEVPVRELAVEIGKLGLLGM